MIVIILILISLFVLSSGIALIIRNNMSQKTQVKEQIPSNTITIRDYKYLPESLIIKKGTTVTWINQDIAKHTITRDQGLEIGPESDYFGQNQEFKFTYEKAGTYNYHCEPHPYMKARVEVVE